MPYTVYGAFACSGGVNVWYNTNGNLWNGSCTGTNGSTTEVRYAKLYKNVRATRTQGDQSGGCGWDSVDRFNLCYTFRDAEPYQVTLERVKAKLVVTPGFAALKAGQSVTFTLSVAATEDAAAPASIIPFTVQGWTFTPDGGTAAPRSCYLTCAMTPSQSGWLKVTGVANGEPQEVNVRIKVYTSVRLDPPPGEYHVGDTVTFRPYLDGEQAPASSWRFKFSGDSTLDCRMGDTACKQLMRSPGAGTMTAYIRRGDNSLDSASTGVTVRSVLKLLPDKTELPVGDSVKFTFLVDGQASPAAAWRWEGPSTTEPTDCTAGQSTCTQLARNPGTAMMWAYTASTGGDSVMADVTVRDDSLAVDAVPRVVLAGDTVQFQATSEGNTIEVLEWSWVPEGSSTLALQSIRSATRIAPSTPHQMNAADNPCVPASSTCSQAVFTSGIMWVRARINGVERTAAAGVRVQDLAKLKPPPSGWAPPEDTDSLPSADDPAPDGSPKWCPSDDQMVRSPVVRNRMRALWDSTKRTGLEFGSFVYADSVTQAISVGPILRGEPRQVPAMKSPPSNACAAIHTHPHLEGRDWDLVPSPPDQEYSDFYDLTMYLVSRGYIWLTDKNGTPRALYRHNW